jgi:hypothetical protein
MESLHLPSKVAYLRQTRPGFLGIPPTLKLRTIGGDVFEPFKTVEVSSAISAPALCSLSAEPKR